MFVLLFVEFLVAQEANATTEAQATTSKEIDRESGCGAAKTASD